MVAVFEPGVFEAGVFEEAGAVMPEIADGYFLEADGSVLIDPDVAYPIIADQIELSEGLEESLVLDQYWLEIIYQMAKLDAVRLVGKATEATRVQILAKPAWALSGFAAGDGVEAALTSKEPRRLYRDWRTRLPLWDNETTSTQAVDLAETSSTALGLGVPVSLAQTTCTALAVVIQQSLANEWNSLHIRTAAQKTAGTGGGEGFQIGHGLSAMVGDRLFWQQDVGGIWRSDDAGQSWHVPLRKGLWAYYPAGVEMDRRNNDIVLVAGSCGPLNASGPDGISRSTDGGDSFTQVLTFNCLHYRVTANRGWRQPLCQDTLVPDTWYFYGYRRQPGGSTAVDGEWFRSTNNGLSWTSRGTTLASHGRVTCLRTNGVHLYLGTHNGLFRKAVDGTGTFTSYGNLPGSRISWISCSPVDPDEVWVMVRGQGLYRHTGSGNFTLVQAAGVGTFEISPATWGGAVSNRVIVMGTHPGVSSTELARSTNGGSSWVNVSIPTPTGGNGFYPGAGTYHGQTQFFAPHPTNSAWWSMFGDQRFHRSENMTGGSPTAVWSSKGFTGISVLTPKSLWFHPTDWQKFNMGCNDLQGRRTQDGGLSFSGINFSSAQRTAMETAAAESITMGGQVVLERTNGASITMVVGEFTDTGKGRSTNFSTFGDFDADFRNCMNGGYRHPSTQDTLFCGDQKSVNDGQTFSSSGKYVLGMTEDGARIFGTDNPGSPANVYYSDNAGSSWTLEYTGDLDAFETDRFDNNNFYVTYANGVRKVLIGSGTTDYNIKSLITDNPPVWYVNGIVTDPEFSGRIVVHIASCGNETIFQTLDGGSTWTDITNNCNSSWNQHVGLHPLTGNILLGGITGTRIFPAPASRAGTNDNALYDSLWEPA